MLHAIMAALRYSANNNNDIRRNVFTLVVRPRSCTQNDAEHMSAGAVYTGTMLQMAFNSPSSLITRQQNTFLVKNIWEQNTHLWNCFCLYFINYTTDIFEAKLRLNFHITGLLSDIYWWWLQKCPMITGLDLKISRSFRQISIVEHTNPRVQIKLWKLF